LLIAITLIGVCVLLAFAWTSHRKAVLGAQHESYQQLQETLAGFESIFNDAPIGYQDVDVDGMIIRVNEKECLLRGLRADEMLGRHFWDLFPEPHQKRIREEVRKKLSGEASLVPIQRNFLRPDGRLLTLEVHEALLRDHKGKVLGMRSASVDMTEPTKKQEQVWQATSELNAVFQAFPDLFLRLDSSGIILGSRSPSHSEVFRPGTDFTGRPMAEMFPAEVNAALQDAVSMALRNGQLISIEYSMIRSESWTGSKVKHFEARVIPLHWNEVVVIVREMTERKEAEQRLAQYADELKRKNEEVEAKNVELVKALATAREATKLKSQFLANMSHEIRTPMNGVLGMTEFLLGTDLNIEQKEYAQLVKQSAEGLLVIINDILDLSKIEAGKMTVESIPFDLMSVLKEVGSGFSLRARAKGLEFHLDLHLKSAVTVRSDPGRIRQILTNLLGNALKFTESGGIVLRTRVMNDGAGKPALQIQVEDTGIGIPDDQRDRLFQSFTQVDGSMTRKYGGTGLGLAISKQLVAMLGGTIGFKSQYRRGSLFWFTVPYDAMLAERALPDAPPASSLGPLTLDGVPVLIAGEPGTELAKLLKVLGCRAEEVSRINSIVPALRLAAQSERPYRLALVDTNIAGMGGLSLGRTIREDLKIQKTILVALSSDPANESPRLFAEGFAGIVPKPPRVDQLRQALLDALRNGATGGWKASASSAESPVVAEPAVVVPAKIRIPKPAVAVAVAAPTVATVEVVAPVVVAPVAAVVASSKLEARILLAEDNLVNQKIALRLLEKAGLSADLAKNGKEAVDAVRKTNYDLILMDCQMPEMDGFEATAAIRKLEDATRRHTPIVALTANAMTGDRERCLDCGMDDYVSKPFDVKALQRLITQWLQPAVGETLPEAQTAKVLQ
jgi:PAS domain S-box-containing protein